MKKIIFSNFDDMKNPYYGGGGAFSVHEVVKRLADKGYDVTVITGKYPQSKDEITDNVKYKRIGLKNINPKLGQLLYQFLLPFYAMTLTYDIWFESYTPPFSTAFLPLFTKKPVIGVIHLLGGVEMSKHYKLPFDIIEKYGLKVYKDIIALNESLKNQVERTGSKAKVHIIPNGENDELLNLVNDNKTEDNILFIGRIDIKHKGLDMLLDIYKNSYKNHGLDLVIAGSGMEKEINILKNRIKEMNLESKVKLIGKVSGKEKSEVFRKAKIFVMTSRIEAFPRTLLEAWCYEVPPIIFDIEPLSWIPSPQQSRQFYRCAPSSLLSQELVHHCLAERLINHLYLLQASLCIPDPWRVRHLCRHKPHRVFVPQLLCVKIG
jgi:glycosyltransferase involved in cell wall biosynthesis